VVGCRQLPGGPVGTTEYDGDLELPAGHVPDLRRIVDDLVERDEGEVERHELDNRPEPLERSTNSDSGKACFGDWCIDHTLRPELFEHAFAHFVRSVVLGDFLTHEENILIPLHFLDHRRPDRFTKL